MVKLNVTTNYTVHLTKSKESIMATLSNKDAPLKLKAVESKEKLTPLVIGATSDKEKSANLLIGAGSDKDK